MIISVQKVSRTENQCKDTKNLASNKHFKDKKGEGFRVWVK